MVKTVVAPKDTAPKKWKCTFCKGSFEREYKFGPKPKLCLSCKVVEKKEPLVVPERDYTKEAIDMLKNALFNSKMVSEEIYEAQNSIKYLIFVLWFMQLTTISVVYYSLWS